VPISDSAVCATLTASGCRFAAVKIYSVALKY